MWGGVRLEALGVRKRYQFSFATRLWRPRWEISKGSRYGDELATDRQAIKFFYTAKGSSAEVFTQAIIAHEIGYLTKQHFDHVKEECQAISKMLTRLIQARSAKPNNEER